jgi:signal recognition particle subunit SRP54
MTPTERANPKMIDGSRRARIAKGSGRTVADVNQLVDRFFEARKMMQQVARGGMPGLPGMPGMGLGKKAKGRQAPQQKKGKGARRSGNPAKAAQDAQRAAEQEKAAAGSAFGLPAEIPDDFDPSQLPDLSKYLK